MGKFKVRQTLMKEDSVKKQISNDMLKRAKAVMESNPEVCVACGNAKVTQFLIMGDSIKPVCTLCSIAYEAR